MMHGFEITSIEMLHITSKPTGDSCRFFLCQTYKVLKSYRFKTYRYEIFYSIQKQAIIIVIFNHAFGRNFFENEANYIYFLNKYKEYIHPIADTFSYVLAESFLFLIEIRNKEELYEHYRFLKIKLGKNVFTDHCL